jgi:hypothetical protein
MQFLLYYNKARNEGLSPPNIKAGWKAANIYPWNPLRAIRSSQVTQLAINTPYAPQAPKTPARPKRKASPGMDINTPQNRRQLQANLDLILQSCPLPHAARVLFQKTGKGFDILNARGAQDGLKITCQSARLQQLEQKKTKKVAIDSNTQFADIQKTATAQRAVAAQTEAWERQNSVRARRLASNRMIEGRMED